MFFPDFLKWKIKIVLWWLFHDRCHPAGFRINDFGRTFADQCHHQRHHRHPRHIVTIIIISGGFFHSGICWSKSWSSMGSTSPKTNVLLLIRSHSYWKWSICIYFPQRKDWLVLISGFCLGLVSAQNSHGFYMETVPDVLLLRLILMQLRLHIVKKLHDSDDSVRLLVGIQSTNI